MAAVNTGKDSAGESQRPRRRATVGGPRLPHLSPRERAARGKAARVETPRSRHTEWQAWSERPDPIALLEEQATTRVPELVPIRYGRMVASAFAFFRGAAYVMASDLASTPRSGLQVQLCGDAHLSNFGGFASPERDLVFDVNDFDETLPGPWEWDLKRLAASPRDRGPRARLHRRPAPRDGARRGRRVPRRDAPLRGDARPRHLVRPPGPRLGGWRASRPRRPAADQATPQGGGEGRDQGQLARLRTPRAHRRRRAADHQRPAVDHPGRGPARRPSRRASSRRACTPCCAPTARACRVTAGTYSSTSATPTSRAKSSGWAPSAPARGWC